MILKKNLLNLLIRKLNDALICLPANQDTISLSSTSYMEKMRYRPHTTPC